MMKSVVAFLLVVLLAVPSGLAWSQLSGDEGRTGIAHLPSGPMDVLSMQDLSDQDIAFLVGGGPGLVSTSQGLALLTEGNGCTVALLAFPADWTTLDVPECVGTGAVMVGYDDVLDRAVLCSHDVASGAPLVQAIQLEPAGLAWSISAEDLGAPSGADTWSCGAPAVDQELGAVIVPAVAATANTGRGTDHRIAKVLMETGDVEWSSFLDAALFAEQSTGQAFDPTAPFRRTEPEVVTRTSSGLVVMGQINDASAALTLDLEGTVTGVYEVSGTDTGPVDVPGGLPPLPAVPEVPGVTETVVPDDGSRDGNAWAVASGPFAIVAIGNQILAMDPLLDGGSQASTTSPLSYPHPFIGPVLLQDLALVPARNGLVAIDSGNLQVEWQRLAVPNADQYGLIGALTAADGRIFSLETHPTYGERLLQLDAESGRRLVEWPIPLNISAAEATTTRLTAVPGAGLVILQEPSTVIVMGPRATASRLGMVLSDDAPLSGTLVTLDLADGAVAAGDGLEVHWGDGLSSTFAADSPLTHIYYGSGLKTITAVLAAADGTTWSETIVADVDGASYSWIETQFLPGNLDMTWGVIGIALGLIGGLATYIVTTMKRRRMKHEMDRLDDIRTLAIEDPIMAMGQLRKYRFDLRERAKKGKLDDPPLGSILQEVSKLFHVVEQRMLTALGPRMSAGMRSAMDAAFADGVLSRSEISNLRGRLKKESRLTDGEQNDLDDLLSNWV